MFRYRSLRRRCKLHGVLLPALILSAICLIVYRFSYSNGNHHGRTGTLVKDADDVRGGYVSPSLANKAGPTVSSTVANNLLRRQPAGAADAVDLKVAANGEVLNKSSCDNECLQFRRLFDSWPAGKPKGAIYFLIQESSLKLLRKSLSALDRFFNNEYRYPLIMFFEKDLDSPEQHQLIRSMTNSTVFMQLVQFSLPSFLTKPVPHEIRGSKRVYGIGYRHMCRFHAKLVYEQPIISGLEYAWRLDHDSFITRPILYDVFDEMRKHDWLYGFVKVYRELPMWTTGLWKTAREHINEKGIKPQFFKQWPANLMYYNNFEVSKLSLWLSPQYQEYIEKIDQNGGIYYHRWGDAPIKSIAVAMFVPRLKTHNFKEIGYIHQFFKRP